MHRRPSYHNLIQAKRIKSGVAADDGVAIRYVDQTIKEVISSRPCAQAYKVTYEDRVKEEPINTRNIGEGFETPKI